MSALGPVTPQDNGAGGVRSSPVASLGLDLGSGSLKAVLLHPDGRVEDVAVLAISGNLLVPVAEVLPLVRDRGYSRVLLGVTGCGARAVCEPLDLRPIGEVDALAAGVSAGDPSVRTIIEMGRESQKYILLAEGSSGSRAVIEDVALGAKCAAGTGSFLEHIRRRLGYESLEEFGRVAAEAASPVALAGRCGVFAESDIVHLYQKGTPRDRIAAGVYQAVCRTCRTAVIRGRPLRGRVAFVGGVSGSEGARRYLGDELGLDGELIVPERNITAAALGAALEACTEVDLERVEATIRSQLGRPLHYSSREPLASPSACRSAPVADAARRVHVARAGLGVDIGSVSTKAVLVTELDGRPTVLASWYGRTEGDPLTAVRGTLRRIADGLARDGITIDRIVAGTTGSGRYLTADYVGADLVRNEITAQAQGTRLFAPEVDTILEIGGQDSKYVHTENGIVVDFEMNRACAAGTGAFLEKQAENLGLRLEEFGDAALRGTAPPELDWQCTVFAESTLLYYLHHNVSRDDLAAAVCLSAARNYLSKTVGNRPIGRTVAFQGAVAFNRGMVAALEAVLGRPVTVPPYPHLTGAAGVAWLAYRDGPEEPSFVGFDQLEASDYRVSTFECSRCANRCEVNAFELRGRRFFYNDRCERYSLRARPQAVADMPDLFGEYEAELIRPRGNEPPVGARRVSVPRGLLFADYYPLWSTFFRELGYAVAPSEPTTQTTVTAGCDSCLSEPCLPMKVAHGHVAQALETRPDILFLPAVHNTEQPVAGWSHSETCPYLQCAPEVIGAALRLDEQPVTVLSPRFHLRRGPGHVRRVLREMARGLGVPRREADRATDAGLEALAEFRRWVDERGRQVLDSLEPEDTAFVVVGRPYALHDPAVNMRIGRRIADLGVLAIPQEFLPLDSVDPSDSWPTLYSRQVQRRVAAARLIRGDPRLRAVVVTYFGCGPDSFATPFFRDELGGPCFVMQIDEHTADAGIVTRLEAFADTARAARRPPGESVGVPRPPRMSTFQGSGLKLWLPTLGTHSDALAAVLRAWGIDAQSLPAAEDPSLAAARKAIGEDVCLPALMTTQEMLERTAAPGFRADREAFFQGQAMGPCRYGMYHALQRRILDGAGFPRARMVTLGTTDSHGGLGPGFLLACYDIFVMLDVLGKLLLHTRPYEREAGASQALFERYLARALALVPGARRKLTEGPGWLRGFAGLHLGESLELLREAQDAFARLPRVDGPRPVIGLVGEFYVRLHPTANDRVIDTLEREGAEVCLAPTSELFAYSNYMSGLLARDELRDGLTWAGLRSILLRRALARLSVGDEHSLFGAACPYLGGFGEVTPALLIEHGARHIHPFFGGEPICSLGKARDFALKGLDGIVNVMPFGCMPGIAVSALAPSFREDNGRVPFVTLEYNGFGDAARETRIRGFVRQATDYRARR